MRLIDVTNFVDEMDMKLYEFAKRLEREQCADLKRMDAQMRGMVTKIDEIGKKVSDAGLKVRKEKKKRVSYNTKGISASVRAQKAAYTTLKAIHSGNGSGRGSGSGSDSDRDIDPGSGTGSGNSSDRDTVRDDDK